MPKLQKSPYTGKYQVGQRIIISDGGQWFSYVGTILIVRPEKKTHNYQVRFEASMDRFMTMWFSEGELLSDLPTPTEPEHPRYTFEFGIGNIGDADDPYYDLMTMPPTQPRSKLDMVECDCGHTVSHILAMSASRGSTCPDCYDEMSN